MKLCIALVICVVLVQHGDCHRRGGSGRGSADVGDFESNSQNQQQQRQQRDEEMVRYVDEYLELVGRLQGSGAVASGTSGHGATLTGVEALRQKIRDRLDNSPILGSVQNAKRKLIEFANSKMNQCKTVGGDRFDKHCAGRVTGKMMQLIASLEELIKN